MSLSSVSGDPTISIPKEQIELFSPPINHDVPELPEQTVAWWLSEGLRREDFGEDFGNTRISVGQRNGVVEVKFTGPGSSALAELYKNRLTEFFRIGKLAQCGVEKLRTMDKWKEEWRFLLPLGLPLATNKSVELLHFPPIAVLDAYQDYLRVPTTVRWSHLLEHNDAKDTDSYQAIVDIAPIAAPEAAGREIAQIEGIYNVIFRPYIDALIKFWTVRPDSSVRPMVAFGGPARRYLKEYLDNHPKGLGILEYSTIKLDDGTDVSVLGANHPSRFYFAVAKFLQMDPNNMAKAVAIGIKVTRQDLIAARWQVLMSREETNSKEKTDGKAILDECKAYWAERDQEICKIVLGEGGKPPLFRFNAEAEQICARLSLDKTFAARETVDDAFIDRLVEGTSAE
jgi:hypothetical protein